MQDMHSHMNNGKTIKNKHKVWWLRTGTPALWKLRQEAGYKSEASLGYIVSSK